MSFDSQQPYNDLPLLPPKAPLETRATLKAAIDAHRTLAELKGVGDLIPNQSILLRAIALQEAKFSSEIESIVTTNDELYRAFSDEPSVRDERYDPHTKEVLRYQHALWHGVQTLAKGTPLYTRLFEQLVQIIKQNTAGVRKTAGTTLADQATGAVVYTPPEGEQQLRDLLANFEAFIHAQDNLDPLIKLAVIHYQFEAIHPFSDGNGRAGRILNILYLIDRGLLHVPVLYLSHYIIAHKADYYAGLRRVTETQAWEPWVLWMLKGIEQMAAATRDRILAIRQLMDRTQAQVSDRLPRIYSKQLVELLFERPYCKIKFLSDAGVAKRQTASQYLKQLADSGILNSVKRGREMIYVNSRFYKLLVAPLVEPIDTSL